MSATLFYPNNQIVLINYFNKIQKNISNLLIKKYNYLQKIN